MQHPLKDLKMQTKRTANLVVERAALMISIIDTTKGQTINRHAEPLNLLNEHLSDDSAKIWSSVRQIH